RQAVAQDSGDVTTLDKSNTAETADPGMMLCCHGSTYSKKVFTV
ncbi:hypothetical protein STIAU_3113, partial [Stigmatella aurantiaca DW4/3-1]